MKLLDYKHSETGEVREVDVAGHDPIPKTVSLDGDDNILSTEGPWERVWGQVAVNMPLHMTAAYMNKHHRFTGKGPSSSPTGKKTLF